MELRYIHNIKYIVNKHLKTCYYLDVEHEQAKGFCVMLWRMEKCENRSLLIKPTRKDQRVVHAVLTLTADHMQCLGHVITENTLTISTSVCNGNSP